MIPENCETDEVSPMIVSAYILERVFRPSQEGLAEVEPGRLHGLKNGIESPGRTKK